MKLYVQSAGLSQDQDYFWQEITKHEQKPIDEPDLVKKYKLLLETQAYSIFIGRESGNLILLVTGMKASKRKDYRGRTIRNSIALIAQDNEQNEQQIRGIAVLALEGKLQNDIDSAIKEGGEYGFEVSYEQIEHAIKASLQTKNSTGTKHLMIGKNSDDNRKIIADELKEYRLPQKSNASDSEALVVVTGIKKQDDIKKAGVWRGLSNLGDNEDLSPYEPPNSDQNFFPSFNETTKSNQQLGIRLIISLGVIGLIALWFLGFFGHPPIGQKPTTVVLADISRGGEYFVTADPHGKVLVQDTQDKTNNTIKNKAAVKSVALSSDGSYVVTGDETGKVQLWDVTNKKNIELRRNANLKHEKAVLSLAINSNSSRDKVKIVSGGADGQVLLWNVNVNVNQGKGEANIERYIP
ncbi:MAG: hypothetical protein F6K50_18975 [Moorea sp. SIO3I7]|uniref:WD40 repeat domain-containing protein n=1 Tax=Moorena sp. SIO3I8 TaxID=2607833 RepID=UPI0013BFFB6D|nr:hypothetical protein [Moorena sp. SIO3I8]NEN97531.1 hypothetical protein [Moorena sp. SIO3I7]NEO05584.1 hypothetical protein [Moorena sp. SIO3I8]